MGNDTSTPEDSAEPTKHTAMRAYSRQGAPRAAPRGMPAGGTPGSSGLVALVPMPTPGAMRMRGVAPARTPTTPPTLARRPPSCVCSTGMLGRDDAHRDRLRSQTCSAARSGRSALPAVS